MNLNDPQQGPWDGGLESLTLVFQNLPAGTVGLRRFMLTEYSAPSHMYINSKPIHGKLLLSQRERRMIIKLLRVEIRVCCCMTWLFLTLTYRFICSQDALSIGNNALGNIRELLLLLCSEGWKSVGHGDRPGKRVQEICAPNVGAQIGLWPRWSTQVSFAALWPFWPISTAG